MADSIDELRTLLFETIRAVKDPANPLGLDRAKAVGDLAQVIINTAKVEVDFLRANPAASGTGFISDKTVPPGQPRLVKGQADSGSR